MVTDDANRPREPSPSVPVIGYMLGGFAYIIPNIVYREVCKVQPVN